MARASCKTLTWKPSADHYREIASEHLPLLQVSDNLHVKWWDNACFAMNLEAFSMHNPVSWQWLAQASGIGERILWPKFLPWVPPALLKAPKAPASFRRILLEAYAENKPQKAIHSLLLEHHHSRIFSWSRLFQIRVQKFGCRHGIEQVWDKFVVEFQWSQFIDLLRNSRPMFLYIYYP
jgi:hypothetical protein